LIILLALEFHAQTPPAQTQKPPQTQAPQTPPAQTQKSPQTQAPQTPPAQTQKPPQTQAPQTPPPAQTPAPAQAPSAAAKPPGPDPLQLAEDWLARLNNLSNWTLTFEGKEVGREDLVNKMMELYAPDVVAEVPPHDDEQIGPVILRGRGNVQKWV